MGKSFKFGIFLDFLYVWDHHGINKFNLSTNMPIIVFSNFGFRYFELGYGNLIVLRKHIFKPNGHRLCVKLPYQSEYLRGFPADFLIR